MKKYLLFALIAAGATGIIWLTVFYWQNLRGIWPALKPLTKDITKLLPPETPPPVVNETELPLKLPAGGKISIFAKDLINPRVMIYDPSGNIIASIPSQGKVVALPDKNNDGIADEIITIAEGLNYPHGLAARCDNPPVNGCELYIAETDGVAVYNYNEKNLKAVNRKKIIDLPDGGNHITRTLLFMPTPNENKLLISVGSSCNICEEKDWRRAKILIAEKDASGDWQTKTFASGLRNSVFITIHPITEKIWATDMGRDLLGDNLPPDEINIIEENAWYGWPWFYGKNVEDYNFSPNSRPQFATKPKPSHIDIPAHSSPLGLAFIPKEGWPQEYWRNLLVAYHGSWNRTAPTGYKIVRYKLDEQGNFLGQEDFITGWLTDEDALGRPVDILIQPNGVIHISDDKAGVIYQVTL